MRIRLAQTTVGKLMFGAMFTPKRFALGFTITQWNIELDLGFIALSVDW